MSRIRQLLTSAAALIGMRSVLRATSEDVVSTESTPPQIHFRQFLNFGPRMEEGGRWPDIWGGSPQCARIVRKNRLRRLKYERYERRRKGGRTCTAKR